MCIRDSYIFGHKRSTDVRREDYEDYHYTMGEVTRWIEQANKVFPSLLKENGLLFFKYTDVFSLNDRQFYFCSAIWNQVLSNFRAKDHYICLLYTSDAADERSSV